MLLVQGIIYPFVYYVTFSVLINSLKLNTPGREDIIVSENDRAINYDSNIKSYVSKYSEIASNIILGLGNSNNIKDISNCVTRLRLSLNDNSIINEQLIKKSGPLSVTKSGNYEAQVIIGTHVQQVAEEIQNQLNRR